MPQACRRAYGWHLSNGRLTPLSLAIRRVRLWRKAGGRKYYRWLTRDFRVRLMNEDYDRRVGSLPLAGFPSLSADGLALVNVNRSLLPHWVPFWIRALWDRYKALDLVVSINELGRASGPYTENGRNTTQSTPTTGAMVRTSDSPAAFATPYGDPGSTRLSSVTGLRVGCP